MPLLKIQDLLEGDPKEVAALLGQAALLSQQFDEHLRNKSQGGEKRAPGLHASEIHGCERRIVYSLLGYPRREDNVDVTWRKRFMMGHAVHDMLQKEFYRWASSSRYRITFEAEMAIQPAMGGAAAKWDIQSHCDGMFVVRDEWDSSAAFRMLLEIKTASPTEFAALTKPKPEHIEQAHVYMACLDVPMVWLLYWNKGNQNTTGTDNPKFLVQFSPRVWASLEERFEKVHQAAALEQLPERTESVVCSFCAFAHECKPTIVNKTGRGHPTPPRWMR